MKKILIISDSPLESDPRVYKQIKYLKEKGYYVATAGKSPSGIEGDFINISVKQKKLSDFLRKPDIDTFLKIVKKNISNECLRRMFLKIRCYERYYWNSFFVRNSLEAIENCKGKYDLIIANDIPVLPLSLKLAEKNNAKVYIDAHEYEPRQYNTFKFNFFYKNYWYYICKKYLPQADYMTTVCDGIAETYSSNFKVKCDVMMNLPFYCNVKPKKCSKDRIRMIHHGGASEVRRLEKMIELMDYLDERFELDFMFINNDCEYVTKLKKLASKNNRIRFLPPVNMPEIPEFINKYDIGIFLLLPHIFNYKMALPNKLFEFIQGRLAVAIWPSQEMVKIVNKYEIGVYSQNFDVKEMADVLNNLTEKDINVMKKNSDIAAKVLNSEQNKKQLYSIIMNLIG
ncbi:MAG TPA: hypothetical protein PLA54_12770 [Spirochaetota bacterium]|nr:hypothetical protein [Spirochaetota bacterium]